MGLALPGGMLSWTHASVPLGSFLLRTPDQCSLSSVLVSEAPSSWGPTEMPSCREPTEAKVGLSQIHEAVLVFFFPPGLLRAFGL